MVQYWLENMDMQEVVRTAYSKKPISLVGSKKKNVIRMDPSLLPTDLCDSLKYNVLAFQGST